MKYFLLRLPSDPKIIGVTDGGGQVQINPARYGNKEEYRRIESFFSYTNYWRENKYIPDFSFEIHADIKPKAKLTDFLHFSPSWMGCPFMIHDKVAEVFSKYRFPEYRLYPITLYKGKEVINHDYKLFCCKYIGFEVVDFPQSVFYTGNKIRGKKYHPIHNIDEFLSFIDRRLGILETEAIKLNDQFDKTLDFYMGRIGEIHVSEGLKEAIQKNGFTGVTLRDDVEPRLIV